MDLRLFRKDLKEKHNDVWVGDIKFEMFKPEVQKVMFVFLEEDHKINKEEQRNRRLYFYEKGEKVKEIRVGCLYLSDFIT